VFDTLEDENEAYAQLEDNAIRVQFMSGFGGREWIMYYGTRSSF